MKPEISRKPTTEPSKKMITGLRISRTSDQSEIRIPQSVPPADGIPP